MQQQLAGTKVLSRSNSVASTTCDDRTDTFGSSASKDEEPAVRMAIAGSVREGLLARRQTKLCGLLLPMVAGHRPSVRQLLQAKGYTTGAVIGRSNNRGFEVVVAQEGGRRFAAKMTHEDERDGVLGNFLQSEYEILCGLRHPCVVEPVQLVQGVGSALVMELCSGSTLRALLPQDGALSAVGRREVLGGILDALAYLHRCGVAHRDMHSKNVLVDASDCDAPKVKIVDFGSAVKVENPSHAAAGLEDAEQRIMPPECGGENTLFACDVFAVGLLAAGLVSCRPIFTADVVRSGRLTLPPGPIRLSTAGSRHMESLLAVPPEERPGAEASLAALPGSRVWAAA